MEEANPAGTEAAEMTETSTPPKRISLTDPAASWTAAKGGLPFFAYSTNYLIDLQAGIIVDVEATPANRSHEVESTRTMIERVEQRRDLKPRRLVGDTAYGSAAMLAWMIEEKEIAPHVPGTHYAVTGASSGIRARVSRRLTRSSIGQASWTARAVR
ncbi:hypothetical protein OKW49_008237 [Paraburkholderia youngii]